MDKRETIVNPDRLSPERLIDFLDSLREAGYNIGVSQYIAAQDLILALLAGSAESIDPPQRLGNLLGPLLCSSPSEQEDFQYRFNNWLKEMGVSGVKTETDGANKPVRDKLNLIEKLRGWYKFGLKTGAAISVTALLCLFVRALVLRFGAFEQSVVAAVSAWRGFGYVFFFGVLPVLLLIIGWRAWIYYNAHLFIVRRQAAQQPQMERVYIKKGYESLWSDMLFFRIAAEFRRRMEVPSEELDVAKTVEQTARQCGWFTPAYGRRQVVPEYIALIDRVSYEDHQARYCEEMVEELKRHEVLIRTYYFDGDPRICFSGDIKGHPVNLYNVALKHDDSRLIIFSDGSFFFNSRTGKPEPWIEIFSDFPCSAMLTTEQTRYWSYRENTLQEYFSLYPFTPSGLTAFIKTLHKSEPPYDTDVRGGQPFPEPLSSRARLWVERHMPAEEVLVQEMLTSLVNYLGAAGAYWLSACAVYPEIKWHLTMYFGNTLSMESGMKLKDSFPLEDLIRLPWLRYGYMPDWLRTVLIRELSPDKEKDIRSALDAYITAGEDTERAKELYLEIATSRHRSALSALSLALRRALLKQEPKDSPLKDYVFETFMAGRKPGKLVVRLPKSIQPRPSVITPQQAGTSEVDKNKAFRKVITNRLGMTFIYIQPGKFMMGSPEDEPGRYDNEKLHEVTLTRGFYMQTTAVTVGQWRQFVKETGYKSEAETGDGAYTWTESKWKKKKEIYWDNPGFEQTDEHPVTCVSWNDAQKFIKWLNTKGQGSYRLPTEAEWEYACRAGTTTPFAFGKCLSTDEANYNGNYPLEGCSPGEYRGKTIPVGSLKANAWGLYDMHGNVWEWVQDWYGDYKDSLPDPTGPESGSDRVIRGGGWLSVARICRSASRDRNSPDGRYGNFGFRLCFF
jgi:formylglycine-generating enzyme required for sulfatase activity